jgi:hypothetical protein
VCHPQTTHSLRFPYTQCCHVLRWAAHHLHPCFLRQITLRNVAPAYAARVGAPTGCVPVDASLQVTQLLSNGQKCVRTPGQSFRFETEPRTLFYHLRAVWESRDWGRVMWEEGRVSQSLLKGIAVPDCRLCRPAPAAHLVQPRPLSSCRPRWKPACHPCPSPVLHWFH